MTAKIGELNRIGRENPDDTENVNKVRGIINEILSEARDVLEQFELEVRETPKESKFLNFYTLSCDPIKWL